MQNTDISDIEKKIGYTFRNKQFLFRAFVHSSYANEEKIGDNERMEFFGDAVLEYIVSEYICKTYPDFNAGELSKLRSQIVSTDGLKPIVDELDIMSNLLVAGGAGNIRFKSRKIEANLYEAVLCAIYLDGGMNQARKFVMRTLKKSMDNTAVVKKDSKTLLQEYCQERKWQITYRRESRSGPDDKPRFVYSLWVNGKKLASGSGGSIKNAEQDAASKLVKEWKL